MAATQAQIDAYLTSVRGAFADYGSDLSRYQRLGKINVYHIKLRFRLLKLFVKIIVDYFVRKTGYVTKNFYTIAEARDIMQHINNICGTNHMLNL